MAQKLPFQERRPAWRLDEKTRNRGLRGVAAARRALADHQPNQPHHDEAA